MHPSSVLFTRTPSTGWVVFQEVSLSICRRHFETIANKLTRKFRQVIETTKSFMRDLTVVEQV